MYTWIGIVISVFAIRLHIGPVRSQKGIAGNLGLGTKRQERTSTFAQTARNLICLRWRGKGQPESITLRNRIGNHTFYYWGPGGGGVSYPDQYFFNLRGTELSFAFDGPYENDKTPTERAKKMERMLLASLREF